MSLHRTLGVCIVGSLAAVGCGTGGDTTRDLFNPNTGGSGGNAAGSGGAVNGGAGGDVVAGSGGALVGGSGGVLAGSGGTAGGSGAGGVTTCAAESDAAFCSRLGKACGSVTANDNCGASRTVAICGTCTAPATCSAANACSCAPETDTALCTRVGRNCGAVTAADNCAASRTVASCGACTAPDVCSAGNVCGPVNCVAETDPAFCTRQNKKCGAVTGTDNCGTSRTVASCGTCTAPATCGATNACSCTPEDSAAFCTRLGKACGSVTANDNCGTSRTVTSCGTCTLPQTCNANNACACVAETDTAFCARLGKNCGSVTGPDNCSATRTVASCGLCTAPLSCGGGGTTNVCGGAGTATAFETKAPATGGTTVGLAPKTVTLVSSSTRANKITLGAAKQKVIGFGVSLTESSAKMLQSIASADRTMIIDEYFNPAKGGMNLVRIPIGTSDFALTDYSYQDTAGATFSIQHDVDSGLVQLYLDAQAAAGGPGKIKFLGSPWTAPPWMKSNGLFIGGTLNAASYQAFATYVTNWVKALADKGISVWGVTPQNEPLHMGQFPTMGFPGNESGHTTYVGTALGPTLKAAYPNIKIIGFDHNKGNDLVTFATSCNNNAACRQYADGMANHWYGNTYDPGEASLDTVHGINANLLQIGDEQGLSAINDAAVVNAAWMNDTWFWTRSSPDWANGGAGHPIVNGMFRYVEDIIVTFNHWQQGWTQWNAVTDKWGGPSHGSDPTNAVHAQSPFMVDVCGQQACAGTAFAVRGTKAVFKVPTLYALEHFAKYFKPDGNVLTTTVSPAPPPYYVNPATVPTITRPSVAAVGTKNPDNSIAVNILNMNDGPVDYQIVLPDARIVETTIAGKALQTVLIAP